MTRRGNLHTWSVYQHGPDGVSGNLAPRGAVVKKSGVDPKMFRHRGPAVVFNSEEEVRGS